ncbi:MAG TPA: outer membrane lipoprotein carrier protein LolA [Rhodopila sp.]|nr:outer membrane lipoprotein carrier protein LolA [Rhodopila sp.]
MFLRRRLLIAALPLLTAPVLARAVTPILQTPQDQADIQRVETYLDGLKSLKAHFLQVASDGSLSDGTAWMERPGRMRFQYNPPSPFLLLASSGVLTFHDSSLQQTSNIPLSRTPLGILLADHVTLSGAVTVTDIQRQPGQLQITVVRTATPGDGSLTLIFADHPLALRQWTVVDAQRRVTHVTLENIQVGGTYDPHLFDQVSLPASVSPNPR